MPCSFFSLLLMFPLLFQLRIYVDDLLALGEEKGKAEMHPTKYRVVASDILQWGDTSCPIFHPHKVSQGGYEEKELGGWRHGLHPHHHGKDEEDLELDNSDTSDVLNTSFYLNLRP
ncbi:hypothetical protein C5167_002982 [Papaver somniferum]|uniref:Reverse transcriptase domain-containing protein n=1 Tax=Papaver somniferum TaxID=3469 RepID=A0A4Y7L3K8_PAPSO|nr:uncharacterized protein LOC113307819 [Papaver somniferum]RZC78775.1 hypothetical protein C5167_002982 [Papaver somniferum]